MIAALSTGCLPPSRATISRSGRVSPCPGSHEPGFIGEDHELGAVARAELGHDAAHRAFRSVLLAAKAALFNLVSLAAAYGVLTWVWQDGHGSVTLWGIPATGAVTMWVPLMVFAFLFGLSMDYEVFILPRIREAYDTSGDPRHAVTEGLGRTGRLVTSAAAILMLSFLSMSTGPQTDLKILATGLGAGILVDAIVVRCLLVPAMVALFGRLNWWLPPLAARLLRVPSLPHPASTPTAPAHSERVPALSSGG